MNSNNKRNKLFRHLWFVLISLVFASFSFSFYGIALASESPALVDKTQIAKESVEAKTRAKQTLIQAKQASLKKKIIDKSVFS